MFSAPRSPYEDTNRQHDYSDNGERSKAGRAFPILTIPHAPLHVSLVILISSCLAEQRQDTVGDVEGNDLCRTEALGLKRGRHLRCRVNRLPK